MLDKKRGLVAKCTKNGYTNYLYKVGPLGIGIGLRDNYYMATHVCPSGLYAKDDDDAIECFAKYCGVPKNAVIA